MDSDQNDLEARMTHQEAALDALTRTVLDQQQAIDALRAELEDAKTTLRQLLSLVGTP